MRPTAPQSARPASSNGRLRASAPVAQASPRAEVASTTRRVVAAKRADAADVSPPRLSVALIVEQCKRLPLYDAFSLTAGAVPVWELRPELVTRCLEFVGAEPPPSTLSDNAKLLAFVQEAIPEPMPLRWISEQEYVIGVTLATVRQTLHQLVAKARSKPRIRVAVNGGVDPQDADGDGVSQSSHPMVACAMHVLTAFPQWGDLSIFCDLWQSQVSIVFSTANPDGQRDILFADGLRFRSTMEGGNLCRVEPVVVQGATIYHLSTYGDAGTDKRLWFRFSVSGFPVNQALCFRVVNLTPNVKLYRNGMRPVWRCVGVQDDWKHVGEVSFVVPSDDLYGQLSFYIVPPPNVDPSSELHVAFTIPYGYNDLLRYITFWHQLVRASAHSIRFEERVLCRTPDQRKLHLLIITSPTELRVPISKDVNRQSPYCGFDKGKKVVLISGRVHPGEVTASHAVHGLISFLLSADPRAELLRTHFMFFIVPMLNPDGVARGHTRLDQYGNNLNRCYSNPSSVEHPTVHALKNVFDSLQTSFGERFTLYLDFHSHASQRKAFFFGNFLPVPAQTWNMAFAKLVELHTSNLLEFSVCKFSKADMLAKEGTSRVLFGAGVLNSYTVEVSHFTNSGRIRKALPEGVPSKCEILEESSFIGQCCALALLDLCQVHVSDVLSASGGLEYVTRFTRAAAIAGASTPQRKGK